IGAVLMVAARIVTPAEALAAVDFPTIVLLLGMMLVVGNLRLSGFFERSGELTVTRLGKQHLLPAIIFTTGVLSAFLVNDIVCLVMVPFVLNVTRRLGLPPLRYLLAVATASNIGSVATITGNPQNMLIGSYSGIHYRDFLVHLGPVALAGLFLNWLILHLSRGLDRVAPPLPVAPPQPWARSPFAAGGLMTETTEEVRYPNILPKTALVVAAVLAGFLAGISPALVAALGAAFLLVTRTVEPKRVYEEVDWGLLVFFVGLFVIVAGAEYSGLTATLLGVASSAGLHHSAVFAGTTAVLSNIVSNVPAVMLLKGIVPGSPDPHSSWLLLAMASTLAGNLTITGSIANIIVVERAKGEVQIGFWDYFRVGLPVTLATLVFGWLWLTYL
ncbi:MAG: SLC13 family permease, partial [Candidatus Korobacteraceae bacterium]